MITAIAVVVGAKAAGFSAFWLTVLAGFRPPPADPGLWPVAPQLATLAYGLALIRAFGYAERAGFRAPIAVRGRWLPLVIVLIGPSLAALPIAGIRPPATWDYLLSQYALAGIGEEIVHRGIVLSLLLPLGARRAALLSTFLFAILHFFDAAAGFRAANVGVAFVAFATGLLLCAIRLQSGSLYPSIAAHVIYNVIAGVVRPEGLYPIITVAVVWPFVVTALALLALREQAKYPPTQPTLGVRPRERAERQLE